MPRLRAIAAWAAVALLMPFWAFPTTLAQATEGLLAGTEGLDNEEQMISPADEGKGVIPPPPTGDEDIYKEAPNPEAGHEEELIPPPDEPNQERIIETDTGAS
jgi:hypothetical protein